MRPRNRTLHRTLRLLAAVLVLPAFTCNSEVGNGESVARVTVRVSTDAFGRQADGSSEGASISANGRFVAFSSTATNLAPGDTNGFRDVFVKDRLTGEVDNVTLLPPPSSDPDPLAPDPKAGDCYGTAISEDGRYVVVLSEADLIGETAYPPRPPSVPPAPPQHNVWVVDRVTRKIKSATRGAGLPWPNLGCQSISISRDGRWVVFSSFATNLGYGGTGSSGQIYASDWQTTNPLVLVSRATTGGNDLANGDCRSPRVSGDGRFIAFMSLAKNLVFGEMDDVADIYLGTTSGDPLELVSSPIGVSPPREHSYSPSVSFDGRFVAFCTSNGLIAPGSIGNFAVVLRDRMAGTTVVVQDNIWGFPTLPPLTDFWPRCDVSDDGQTVVYKAFLPPGVPPTDFAQIFALRLPGPSELVSASLVADAPGSYECFVPLLSGDGRWCIFYSDSHDLVPNDTNGARDVFLRGPLR